MHYKFNISKNKIEIFFWTPDPSPLERGITKDHQQEMAPPQTPLLSAPFKCLRHSTGPSPTIFNKFYAYE